MKGMLKQTIPQPEHQFNDTFDDNDAMKTLNTNSVK